MRKFDAIILAGSRPGPDALVDAAGVSTKALVPVAGLPMVCHVGRTLLDHPQIGAITVAAQDAEPFMVDETADELLRQEHTKFVASQGSIAATLRDLFDNNVVGHPVLVTTADNILLDVQMIDQFLRETTEHDLGIAMVRRRIFRERYPEARRTWLKFKGAHWSGANLFWFGSPKAGRILNVWADVEQDRKKARKLLGMFGPWLMIQALLRLQPIEKLVKRAGRKIDIDIAIISMAQPEACIDADKPEDIILIEEILAKRGV